jgi:hypothetical protein
MKKSLLLLVAFAFVGLAGCASEEETDITVDEDTTMVAPVEPMPAPAPMPADTMMSDTTVADTAAGM